MTNIGRSRRSISSPPSMTSHSKPSTSILTRSTRVIRSKIGTARVQRVTNGFLLRRDAYDVEIIHQLFSPGALPARMVPAAALASAGLYFPDNFSHVRK